MNVDINRTPFPGVGDKVEIKAVVHHLKHRKLPVKGTVTNINGSYILVRPNWCKWEVELYPNELKVVSRCLKKK